MAAQDDIDVEVILDKSYYGKDGVRLLRLRRLGKVHEVKEVEVNVHIVTESKKSVLDGDNADVVATDTMKNALLALAKLNGIKSPENFGQILCRHFLMTYGHVTAVSAHIEEAPWKRLSRDGRDHVHAFIWRPDCTRVCDITHKRGGNPVIWAGLKDLKLLKTTLSSFTGFKRDEFTTLAEVSDRLLATRFNGRWRYATNCELDEDIAWRTAVDGIIDAFAGPPDIGLHSSSTQQTLQLAAREILKLIPKVAEVTLELSSLHYFVADLHKFGMNNSEVLIPTDKPHGLIRVALKRAPSSKL